MRLPRRALAVLALVAPLCAGGPAAAGGDKDKDPPNPAVAPAPGSPAPRRVKALTAKEHQALVEVLHKYLDTASAHSFETRLAAIKFFKELADSGEDVLADFDPMAGPSPATLLGAIYSARTFAGPLFKSGLKVPPVVVVEGITTVANVNGVGTSGDPTRLSLSVPKSYPLADPKHVTDHAPWPLIVTLHDIHDYEDNHGTRPFPGEERLKRAWDPHGPMRPACDEWLIVAPVATKAKFLGDDGAIIPRTVADPWKEVIQRYHVDYDRFVLDGRSEALAFAAARPFIYAGVIVRGDEADVAPEVVRNFANMSVYIQGSDKSAAYKTLKDGGFPMAQVKVGPVEGIPDWLKTVYRTLPWKSFHWTVHDSTQRGAFWVDVKQYEDTEAGKTSPTVDAEILDTKADPNTISLKTYRVRWLGISLSDKIVDLDRPVRLIVNGKEVKKAVQMTGGREMPEVVLPAKLDRSFDLMLDSQGTSWRREQYFGLLFPAGLVIRIDTDTLPAGATPETPPPSASGNEPPLGPPGPDAQAEENAKRYFAKAEEFQNAGNKDKARDLYAKAIAEGESSVKARAEARLKALEGPPPGDNPKGGPPPR